MHLVGRINRNIYECVTRNIITDEVIITEERIEHIKERHPTDFERYNMGNLTEFLRDSPHVGLKIWQKNLFGR